MQKNGSKTPSSKLTAWYLANQRDLPWRKNKNPYAIWLSEVMLQQTTVKAVLPYYEKFLNRFPTVMDLAKAKEEEVLSLWSGLGYYSRARNLHAAAKEISFLGKFPSSFVELKKLKGVGPYTAAAVASIAFEESVPVVDGNVIRLITRLYDISEDIKLRATQDLIWQKASELLKDETPSIFNQAMMELGATICTPKNPTCILCPMMKQCKAFKAQTVLLRPVKDKNRKQDPWLWDIYVFNHRGKFAVVKTENGTPWLKNSWVLPGKAKKLKGKFKGSWDLKHSITHHGIFVRVVKAEKLRAPPHARWVSSDELENLGVSSIVKKVIETHKFQKIFER